MAGNFALDISRWVEKAKGNVDLVVRKISLDIFRRVVLRSPVLTGRFVGNWQVDVNSIPTSALNTLDPTGGEVAIARAVAGVSKAKAGDIVYLVNNVSYARRLENGWSEKAPQGMVGITLAEYPGIVAQAATEVASGK